MDQNFLRLTFPANNQRNSKRLCFAHSQSTTLKCLIARGLETLEEVNKWGIGIRRGGDRKNAHKSGVYGCKNANSTKIMHTYMKICSKLLFETQFERFLDF